MGCILSKRASQAPATTTPSLHGSDRRPGASAPPSQGSVAREGSGKEAEPEEHCQGGAAKRPKGSSLGTRVAENSYVSVAAEQATAGWPAWLSAVAAEAIQGLVPLRADSFEKLEKIGQGTYSRVYRARDVETGGAVALKKVQFDNFQAESVRFMAREIKNLRKLDHPNIIKLQGIIASRLSCSIYLVFDYMEHDLTGLLSSPVINFTDAQIKCYMKQLLSGLEHCHSRGVMHRDIKTANILVNNEGVLKIADFGLGTEFDSQTRHLLTSRVVTLWYRPPELILGSTSYGAYVDLWSAGCVFAELLLGKPLLKGKTEVEQLHQIFKLCGSPPEEYWKRSKLAHAALFKPRRPYESCLHERCKELPMVASNLIETLLSLEPHRRGTASSALKSEYFLTEPYACDPSTLPKYPPTKEIDAKSRQRAQRNKAGLRTGNTEVARKLRRDRKILQEPNNANKFAPSKEFQSNNKHVRPPASLSRIPKFKRGAQHEESHKVSFDTLSDVSRSTNALRGDIASTNPLHVRASSNSSQAKGRKENVTMARLHSQSSVRSQPLMDPNSVLDTEKQLKEDSLFRAHTNYERRMDHAKYSFDASDVYRSRESSVAPFQTNSMIGEDSCENIQYSGPLVSQSERMDERLQKNEGRICRAFRRSQL